MNREMSHLKKAVINAFDQLNTALCGIADEAYSLPVNTLFNATIGQHVRHVAELFIELDKGYKSGTVNYEKRKRDHRIETDKHFAMLLLKHIINSLEKEDKPLVLEAGFTSDTAEVLQVQTNYYRELAYNIEHTIHHMALIRVGINELCAVPVNDDFGIAPATIKYRKACVQ